ncbi:hypothetical protein KKD60_04995, partial [Patescibacteria group bacterium]|nr:hypothetical protein [Patescibacteria group bacterium]
DVLNINTIMPRGGGSIKIFHSDKEQGEIPERGKYRCEYEKSDKVDKGNVSVLFAKGHNTNISVDVVRNVKKKADFTRLSNL